jgi:hypothetical protein
VESQGVRWGRDAIRRSHHIGADPDCHPARALDVDGAIPTMLCGEQDNAKSLAKPTRSTKNLIYSNIILCPIVANLLHTRRVESTSFLSPYCVNYRREDRVEDLEKFMVLLLVCINQTEWSFQYHGKRRHVPRSGSERRSANPPTGILDSGADQM